MAGREPPHVYSLTEIAEHLPVDAEDKKRAVRDLIRKHKIPYHKLGRGVGLDDRQLGQLLEATTRCPIQPARSAGRNRRSSSGAESGTRTMSSSASAKSRAKAGLRRAAVRPGKTGRSELCRCCRRLHRARRQARTIGPARPREIRHACRVLRRTAVRRTRPACMERFCR